ncbi:sensor histidine kinase [Mycetocola reblochoni]|uniref:Sensor histidine kinase MtrB n=1 Tax=Mycetocola reblochoni TaxID=331618 RepID=A0A3L6ZR86_9MICO|nr:MtrAB system histidine kinase MtrB [Mycetocola reblochoni]RLP70446.1 sensor histidine kinase [Mycetocola reblochoni]
MTPATARVTRLGPRGWPGRIADSFRRSLQFRTVVVTVALAIIAVAGTSIYMGASISSDMYRSRVNDALVDARRATASAQSLFDSSSAEERAELQNLMSTARTQIAQTASTTLIAGYRAPGQDSNLLIPQDFESPALQGGVVTDDLRSQVQQNPSDQWWQAVALPAEDREVPGVVVGSMITLTDGSRFELYIGYELSDTERTLQFMQRTLLFGGGALLLLVAAVAWVVARLVARPVQVVAESSERLTSGELETRIPVTGEDEIATLASSFNRMADSLQAQIAELEQLSMVQQRFVSDVSHELRTPLTTIRLAGDVLYDQRLDFPAGTARAVELLNTQTRRFEQLLSDLLEISRYDARSVELDREPVNLVQLAEDSMESMAPLAATAGCSLILRAPGGHTELPLDARRIRRIVRNLLGNAIEHGDGRSIVVSIDSNTDAVALGVRDYGQGIAPENLSRVFDRFWRADPARKRTIGGTGLGLAISLGDAQLHGGDLRVWSRPGMGTSFLLILPREGGSIERSPLPLEPDDAGSPDAVVATEAGDVVVVQPGEAEAAVDDEQMDAPVRAAEVRHAGEPVDGESARDDDVPDDAVPADDTDSREGRR